MARRDAQSNIQQALQEKDLLIAALRAENESLRSQVELLTRYLADLQRAVYGRKSEKTSPEQLQLFIDGVRSDSEPVVVDADDQTPDFEVPPARAVKAKRSTHPGRVPLPQHLEREEIHLHPDNLDCPCCGHQMEPAGEEVSEELGIVPARFLVRRRIRHKYACRACEDAVVRPPLPPAAIEKCQAGSDVIAAIIVSKYADHVPLYRQQAIYRRENVELSRVTMCQWIGKIAFNLQPIVQQMKKELLAGGVVQSDDTPVKYLDSPGPAKNGFLWAYVGGDGTVVYDFTCGRSRAGPNEFMAGFQGVLQVDGYAAYNEVVAAAGVVRAACWAHVRRKFEQCLQTDPQQAATVLQKIQVLYRIEQEIRALDPAPDPEQIAAIRHAQSLPVIGELEQYLITCRQEVLPKSRLGQAIEYAFGQWQWLQTYIHDGRVEIDNNSCERAMRKVAVGRKNWLFTGSEGGGHSAATLYSLIETCARLKINPHAYLTDILPRLSTHPQQRVAELTPRGWLAATAGATS
jgi:transposase